MEKRVLLAIFLVFLFLFAYQSFFMPRLRPVAPAKSEPVAADRGGGTTAPGGAGTTGPGKVAAGAGGSSTEGRGKEVVERREAAAVVGEARERRIVVETRVLRAVFSNRGGRAVSWELLRYKANGGRPVDLIPNGDLDAAFGMFDLQVDDESATNRLAEALFVSTVSRRPAPRAGDAGASRDAATGATFLSTSGGAIDGRQGETTLEFEYADAGGLKARKRFRLTPDSYVVEVSAEVSVGDRSLNPTVQLGPGLGDVGAESPTSSYVQRAGGILHQNGKVRRIAAKDLASGGVQEGIYRYAGVDDHYFLSVVLPPRVARIEYRAVPVATPNGKPFSYVEWGVRLSKQADEVKLYIGPKDFDVLASVDRDLVRAINYGIFDWLAVPLLRALKGINNRVGNYGWSIIILTVLINLVMFPLRHKSVTSMRRMQALQPEIKAIQQRYGKLKATDPAKQKMNQELMELYKSRGVNPASGCLPMLLTIPIFIAFYSLLSQAIELRGAPFIFWIRDLSAHDPYYVTPILMGGAWLWQQAMTPSSADPVQQKMFLAMPVVFTIMFLWAPSGLAIYWFVNNVLGIAQQYATNAIVGPVKQAAGGDRQRRAAAKARSSESK